MVGATLGRNPTGLFGAVYTEVPYLDVLRTTTNPSLPLTQLEYEEFGDPATKLQDFGALLNLSPIDLIPNEGIPDVFVLCRTATLDMEVLAYESVKWIRKLRNSKKKGQSKLLAITANEGHFAKGSSATNQRAEDLAILENFVMHRRRTHKRTHKRTHNRTYKRTN